MSQVIRILRSGEIIPTGLTSIYSDGRLYFKQDKDDTRTYSITWDGKTTVTAPVSANNATTSVANTGNTVTLTVSGVDPYGEIELTLTANDGEIRVIDILVNVPTYSERDYCHAC